uniref:Uncharacterized protein n=1 Tax=Opuntia streptacantha TaxID=393608 RepID=A0A7C9DQT5_OPUST
MPSTAATNIQTTSPIFEEIMYLMNCFVLLYIALPSATAATMVAKLSSANTISEALLATAVPEPIAMPISAFFNAGASFTPSPVIATTSFWFCKASTSILLCDGSTLVKIAMRCNANVFCNAGSSSNSVAVKECPIKSPR